MRKIACIKTLFSMYAIWIWKETHEVIVHNIRCKQIKYLVILNDNYKKKNTMNKKNKWNKITTLARRTEKSLFYCMKKKIVCIQLVVQYFLWYFNFGWMHNGILWIERKATFFMSILYGRETEKKNVNCHMYERENCSMHFMSS